MVICDIDGEWSGISLFVFQRTSNLYILGAIYSSPWLTVPQVK